MKLKYKNTPKTPMTDESIVELYWARNEKAIEETDFKYRKYLLSTLYNIVRDSLDCEECLNDTYLGAWNSMPPSKPNSLKAFLITIARRTSIKRYHSNKRKSLIPSEMTISLSELEAFIADDDNIDTYFDAERLGRIISDFIRSLSERRRFIFLSRYYIADPIDTIATDLSLSRSMVNKELAAIRHELKEKLESEGYSL
ncbi:MAG: sigma-70 family RNA polymerase sigma factor [Ruminococcaceae bacterium]|nr:sigma-70 family RNA polymerase sigma factor [Oscillospiraceae bacterium]